MFNFKRDKLDKNTELGKGSFGKVYPYQESPDDIKWAVKCVKIKDVEAVFQCIPEIMIGFACDHPCIVPVKGFSIEKAQNKYNIYMKLPRMKHSLKKEFQEKSSMRQSFEEEEIVRYFYSLVCGVEYLHSKKIFHSDRKIDNILIDFNGRQGFQTLDVQDISRMMSIPLWQVELKPTKLLKL